MGTNCAPLVVDLILLCYERDFIKLNKAIASDTEAPFLDMNLSISYGTVSIKIYDKRDDFDFDIVNFPFFDGGLPRRTSYGVYISCFARASSNEGTSTVVIKPLPPRS